MAVADSRWVVLTTNGYRHKCEHVDETDNGVWATVVGEKSRRFYPWNAIHCIIDQREEYEIRVAS